NARALADDLRRYLAGEPIQARPVGRLERVLRWVRKKPAAAALITLSSVLLIGGIVGLFWYQHVRLTKLLHQQGVDREIALALDEAENLPAEIHRKLADHVRFAELLSDIEGWKTTLDRARAAWDRADKLAAANPEVLDPALLARLKSVGDDVHADLH